MWSSVPLLNSIAFWGLWAGAIFSGLAVVASLGAGLAAARVSDITNKAAKIEIAQAHARAEEAKLETEKLRSRMAWRRLVEPQRTALSEAIKGITGDISVERVKTDAESMNLAEEIDAAFATAGIKHGFFQGWTRAAGLQLHGDNEQTVRILAHAFAEAGLPFDLIGRREAGQHHETQILVGSKIDGLLISDEPR